MHHAPNKCCVFHRNHPYDHIILSVKTWWKSIKIYNPAISIPLFFHKHNVLIQTLAPQRHIDDHRNPKRSQSPLPLKPKLHFCFLCSKHMNLCRYENVSFLHLEENAFRKIPQAHVYNPRHVFSIRVWNARKFSLLLPRRKQLWVILGILEFIAMRGGWFNFFFFLVYGKKIPDPPHAPASWDCTEFERYEWKYPVRILLSSMPCVCGCLAKFLDNGSIFFPYFLFLVGVWIGNGACFCVFL